MNRPRSGIVPALVTASARAPLRARIVPATRSHTIRGRSSPNSSRRVAAVEHVEHVLQLRARQLGVGVGARDERVAGRRRRAARRRSTRRPSRRSAGRARRAGCAARRSARSRPRASAGRRPRTRAGRRGTSGRCGPCEMSPTLWPARPMRCSPAATDFGDSTWSTRSTAPMSMPSSSDEVATRHGSSPAFSSSSTTSRSSRASEPWWARAIVAPPASSFSRSASRSAPRRLLTKTIVERCSWTSFSSSG